MSTKTSPCEEASPLPSVGLLESKYLRTGAEVTVSLILSKATSCSFVHNYGSSLWVRRLIGSQI